MSRISFSSILAVLLIAAMATTATAQTVKLAESQEHESKPAVLQAGADDSVAVISHGEMRVQFPHDRQKAPLIVEHGDAQPLSFEPGAMVARTDDAEETTRWSTLASAAEWRDHLVVYRQAYEGMDARYAAYVDHVKHDVRLHAEPTLPADSTWFGADTQLNLPAGYELRPITLLDEGNSGVADALAIVDDEGDVQYLLPQVVAEDAQGFTTVGRWRYQKIAAGSFQLTAEIDSAWLTTAAYPVDLDPTVFLAGGQNWVTTNIWEFANSLFGGPEPVPSRTFQMLYEASHMGAVDGYITEIGFEPNGSTSLEFDRVRITIGEATTGSYDGPDLTFANNFDGTPMVAYDGPAHFEAPNNEYTSLPLTDFYSYSQGTSLAILVELFDTPQGGGTSYFIGQDLNNPGNPWGAAMLWNEDVNDPTAGVAPFWGKSVRLELRDYYIEDDLIDEAFVDDLPYEYTFTAGGTISNPEWSATGLPSSFSLNPSSGELSAQTIDSGDVGSHQVVITLSEGAGTEEHSREYTLQVYDAAVTVSETVMPEATDGLSYDQYIETSGGSGDFTFSLRSGELPPGLTLEEDGRITGEIPFGSEDTYFFNVDVEDNVTSDTDEDVGMTLVVRPVPEIDISDMIGETLRDGQPWGPQPIVIVGGATPFEVAVVLSEEAEEAGLQFDDEAGDFGAIYADEITGIESGDEVVVRLIARDANHALTVATAILRGPAPVTVEDGGDSCGVVPNSAFGKLVTLMALLAFVALLRRRLA